MTEKEIESIALLRYALVIPAINSDFPEASVSKYFERIAMNEVTFPDGSKRIIRPGTLRMWMGFYKKHGFEGLKPKGRSDNGSFRALDSEQKEIIFKMKSDKPRRTATAIYKQCIKDGIINQVDVSLTTVQRYIARIKPKIGALTTEDVRAFEMEFANQMWQIDTCHGPHILIDGKKTKTYIIMISDDASRMIVGHNVFTEDNGVNVQAVIKDAILTFGIPSKIYTDNGSSYRNEQLELICANLGISLARHAPYVARSKGKQERAFRSMKEGWMYNIDYKAFNSTEALNASLSEYVQDKNQNKHYSLDTTPWMRYLRDQDRIRYAEKEDVDRAFLHTAQRRVNNDATIKLDGRLYEAPQEYIKQRVKLRYRPDHRKVYLCDDKKWLELREVNKIENSNAKRRQPLLTQLEETKQ